MTDRRPMTDTDAAAIQRRLDAVWVHPQTDPRAEAAWAALFAGAPDDLARLLAERSRLLAENKRWQRDAGDLYDLRGCRALRCVGCKRWHNADCICDYCGHGGSDE